MNHRLLFISACLALLSAGCGFVREASSAPADLLRRVKNGQQGVAEGLDPAALNLRALAAAEAGSLYYLGRVTARSGAIDAAAGFQRGA
jgi:hypothetical protein